MNRKIEERKKDELLQYVHQARHADEHRIEPVSEESVSAYLGCVDGFDEVERGSD